MACAGGSGERFPGPAGGRGWAARDNFDLHYLIIVASLGLAHDTFNTSNEHLYHIPAAVQGVAIRG